MYHTITANLDNNDAISAVLKENRLITVKNEKPVRDLNGFYRDNIEKMLKRIETAQPPFSLSFLIVQMVNDHDFADIAHLFFTATHVTPNPEHGCYIIKLELDRANKREYTSLRIPMQPCDPESFDFKFFDEDRCVTRKPIFIFDLCSSPLDSDEMQQHFNAIMQFVDAWNRSTSRYREVVDHLKKLQGELKDTFQKTFSDIIVDVWKFSESREAKKVKIDTDEQV